MNDLIDFDDNEYVWPPGDVPGVDPAQLAPRPATALAEAAACLATAIANIDRAADLVNHTPDHYSHLLDRLTLRSIVNTLRHMHERLVPPDQGPRPKPRPSP